MRHWRSMSCAANLVAVFVFGFVFKSLPALMVMGALGWFSAACYAAEWVNARRNNRSDGAYR
jgi:hypothetical protein